MLRLGLCCLFRKEPICFKTTTARYATKLREQGKHPREYFSHIICENIKNLFAALAFCHEKGIGAFRVTSRLFPLYTHPEHGYTVHDLPDGQKIEQQLTLVKKTAKQLNIRLTLHPDQFVVMNSPSDDVVRRSIEELEYHGVVAKLIGADVINIHGGGGYGDKQQALQRLEENVCCLSPVVRKRLTLENDDTVYTPEELFPVCKKLSIPLVYDVHHHRCLKDSWTIEYATKQALTTWDREPLFHLSSPLGGWKSKRPSLHADFIASSDLPEVWSRIDPLTIDVEAKAKELAVLKLYACLQRRGWIGY